jgi:Arc/MetJ-type ribon-helix-helix transcriptional regulator
MSGRRLLTAEREAIYVTLTDEIKSFVQEKVATGAFPSEEAVLEEAVRRFRQQEQAAFFSLRDQQGSYDDLIDYEAIAS